MDSLDLITLCDRDFWRDRPTLVTGATGFLGGWLVQRLLHLGADVVCLVRDWVPQSVLLHTAMLDRVRVVRGDICEQHVLERTLGEYEIVSVLHLAAQTVVGIANRNPLSTFESNIKGTWTVLEACRRSPLVQQLVIASSDKAYGDHAQLPYDESTPLQGCHPYDVSKSCADLLAQMYAVTYGVPVAITRCGNLFGGGDLNWNRLIPGTIRSILRGKPPTIRSNGQLVRDYLYVEDAVSGYLQLVERMAADPHVHGQAFNFSSDNPVSVVELVQTILALMHSPLLPEISNTATHEIPTQYLNAQKAQSWLGWRPAFTLDAGLRHTIDWYTHFCTEADHANL